MGQCTTQNTNTLVKCLFAWLVFNKTSTQTGYFVTAARDGDCLGKLSVH